MPIHNSLWLFSLVLLTTGTLAGCSRTRETTDPVALDVPHRADVTPSIAAAGSFVVVAWGGTQNGKTDVFLASSRDGGESFSPPVQVNKVNGEARLGGELPPRVALLASSGRRTPEIVVLWTARGVRTEIKVARSTDGGRTFSDPTLLQIPGAEGDRGWPALAVDRQGTAHAIWVDHRAAASPGAGRGGHAPGSHGKGAVHDGVAMAKKSGLYYASVASGTPSPEQSLTPGICYCCKTALAIGPDGTLYAAWRHVYPGNLRDIAFTSSRDGGRTFAAPVRVSEDGWSINGCPDDGPALSVGSDGEVHVVWPTMIGGATPERAIFYSSTRDARNFTPRVRVPTAGLHPSHAQTTIDDGGRLFVAWDDSVSGQRTAAVREVRRTPNGAVEFGPVLPLAPGARANSPVLAASVDRLVAVWASPDDPSRVLVRAVRVP